MQEDSCDDSPGRYVVIADAFTFYPDGSKNEFCQLRHPKNGEAALYLFSSSNSCVSEVNIYQEKFRSWFINESVQQDGSLLIITRMNALYMALPYLINTFKSCNKFMPLDHILTDEEFPQVHRLCQCLDTARLSSVTDVKDAGDVQVYRYNKDKTLSYLKIKVETLSRHFQINRTAIAESNVAPGFESLQDSEGANIQASFAIITEYLPEELSDELREHLGLPAPHTVTNHEKPDVEQPQAKKPKKEGSAAPTEDYSASYPSGKKSAAAKMSAAQKKLAKVDKSGIKSISSFFTAKTTK